MNTRLQQFLDAENLTQAQFAESIGVVPASVSNVLSGKNRPGWDFTANMLKRYPDLNPDWLILGKGKMYRNSPVAHTEQNNSQAVQPISEETEQASGNDVTPDLFLPFGGPADAAAAENVPAPEIAARTPLIDTSTLDAIRQITAKQRKAIKVTVFFDDGTFQEF